MLDFFRKEKEKEIAILSRMEAAGNFPAPLNIVRPSFSAALRSKSTGILPVIAEYKRASPSLGDIRLDLDPEDIADRYANGGAACISVLTENSRFKGDMSFISSMSGVNLPILRKDFIMHSLQVRATSATPASALLLIVRLSPDASLLRDLRELTESFGMEAVVEIFDLEDLYLARKSGARIIQVNSRDLNSLRVDKKASFALCTHKKKGEIWIAASGISKRIHLKKAACAGFDAALVGSSLMDKDDPGSALKELISST